MKRINILFAKRLRELRIAEPITQGMLADFIGVSESTIGMMERAQRLPSIENLWKLADFFQVSLDYLIGRTDTDSEIEITTDIYEEEREATEQEIKDFNSNAEWRKIEDVLIEEKVEEIIEDMEMELEELNNPSNE